MLARSVLLTLLCTFTTPVSLRADDTLESVEATIVQKWSNIRTMSATMTMKMNMGMPDPIRSTGTFEYLYENDREKKRMQMSFDTKGAGQTGPISQTVIFDGEFAWTIRVAMGQTLIAKQRPDAMEGTPGGRGTFEQLRKTRTMKLLPSEMVDGTDAFVIESTVKKGSESGIRQYKFYFAKDTGVLFEAIGFDDDGKPVTAIRFSNVKINPQLDPGRFTFTADPETPILDLTKQKGD